MATVKKHKQRSRKTWQANEGLRKHVFGIMEQNALGVIQSRLVRAEMKGGN